MYNTLTVIAAFLFHFIHKRKNCKLTGATATPSDDPRPSLLSSTPRLRLILITAFLLNSSLTWLAVAIKGRKAVLFQSGGRVGGVCGVDPCCALGSVDNDWEESPFYRTTPSTPFKTNVFHLRLLIIHTLCPCKVASVCLPKGCGAAEGLGMISQCC